MSLRLNQNFNRRRYSGPLDLKAQAIEYDQTEPSTEQYVSAW